MKNYTWEYIQKYPKQTKRLLGIDYQQLEQQKKRLRDKYISLATQVCKLPQFQDRDTRDIDIGVTHG